MKKAGLPKINDKLDCVSVGGCLRFTPQDCMDSPCNAAAGPLMSFLPQGPRPEENSEEEDQS